MRPLTRYQVCRSCQALYKGIRKSAKEHAGKQALPQQAGSPERWVNLLLPPRAILRPSIFPENASLVRLARSGFAPLAALCPPPPRNPGHQHLYEWSWGNLGSVVQNLASGASQLSVLTLFGRSSPRSQVTTFPSPVK